MNLFGAGSEAGWLCPQTYRLDERTQLISRRQGDNAFAYSDGAAIEYHLMGVLNRTTDRSVGSEALTEGIRDWASAYHLSPQRADLFRPLAALLGGNTLEIGAGCGAITRYLGESGGQVMALEGSATRAKMTQLRCADLPNVRVMVENFQTATFLRRFDLVTLIGVLEYSPQYIEAADPVGFMLERARDMLTEDGALVIAIENQLGLKYLSGAPEDHYNIPYLGIEDRYNNTAVTFGRVQLERILREHGFASCEFYYPFGDYKMPGCIVNEACANEADPFVTDLIRTFSRHQPAFMPAFAEETASDVTNRNGLLGHLANSFLVVARPKSAASAETAPKAWAFASARAKPFAKQAVFTKVEGAWHIERRRLYEDAMPPAGCNVTVSLQNETALQGRLMYQTFLSIVNTPGWSATQLAAWARPWMDMLMAARQQPERASATTCLPGSYIDCVPHNVMIEPGGRAVAFDQEWSVDHPVQLGHVMIRGLSMTITRPRTMAAPARGTPTRVLTLVYQVMSLLGITITDAEFDGFCAVEHAFQKAAGNRPPAAPREALFFSLYLPIRRAAARPAAEGVALSREAQGRLLRPFFDAAYYLRRYPDVKQAGVDPLLHYIVHGDAENRDPCDWFSTGHYRKAHPDTAAVPWPGLLHYVLVGKMQNRAVVAPVGLAPGAQDNLRL